MPKSTKNDKILSTPAYTGSYGTSDSSNLTIDSGHVGADNNSFFLELGDKSEEKTHRKKTMNLKPDTYNSK